MQYRPTLTVICATLAATAATLVLALSPAWAPSQAHDGLRVVELPRVLISAPREAQAAVQTAAVVQLPRVVIQGRRLAASSTLAGASEAQGTAQPVMSRQPN